MTEQIPVGCRMHVSHATASELRIHDEVLRYRDLLAISLFGADAVIARNGDPLDDLDRIVFALD
jgi:hypothetical protein